MTQRLLMIYDDGRGQWGPLTDCRAAFDVRSGAVTGRQRIEAVLGQPADSLCVPPHLTPVYQEAQEAGISVVSGALPGAGASSEKIPGAVLLVNGRWVGGPLEEARRVASLPVGEALVDPQGQVIAVHLRPDAAQAFIDRGFELDPATPQRTAGSGALLLSRPWHILEHLPSTMAQDLERLVQTMPASEPPAGAMVLGDFPVRVAPDAQVHPMVVLDARQGSVIVDAGATIGPFCVLVGPCYVGPGTTVQPHTHLRAGCSIGPQCLVAGEISHAIFQGYANKAHAGYLGNALVGQWVNLGANTNASNLKNTYGHVRVQLSPDAPLEDTGLTKLGPLIGDFVRTAISTRLTTGCVLGTGCMVALSGFPPKLVEPFMFLTDAGAQRYDIEKFLHTAHAMMSRRGQSLSEAQQALLRRLHAQRV